ncbi:MAG TPA: hypothetical protein VFY89_05630, partial [Ktedonobacterales bacterium]
MAYPLVLLFALLSLGMAACADGTTTTQTQPPRLRHDAGLACISPPSWAPDGHIYAVVGTTKKCSDQPDTSVALFLFDGATGQLLKQLPLASAFPSPPADGCPVREAPYSLCLSAPLWSPDGQTLALIYITPWKGDATGPDWQHLLLVRADGSGAARLPAPPVPVASSANGTQPVYSRLWDLQTRTMRYFVRPQRFSAARAISWGPHGTLVPQSATAAERSPAPVGNPMGGASFSPWQAGQVQATTDGGYFDAGFNAWSPDGRYLALGLGVEMRITTGVASTQ